MLAEVEKRLTTNRWTAPQLPNTIQLECLLFNWDQPFKQNTRQGSNCSVKQNTNISHYSRRVTRRVRFHFDQLLACKRISLHRLCHHNTKAALVNHWKWFSWRHFHWSRLLNFMGFFLGFSYFTKKYFSSLSFFFIRIFYLYLINSTISLPPFQS